MSEKWRFSGEIEIRTWKAGKTIKLDWTRFFCVKSTIFKSSNFTYIWSFEWRKKNCCWEIWESVEVGKETEKHNEWVRGWFESIEGTVWEKWTRGEEIEEGK